LPLGRRTADELVLGLACVGLAVTGGNLRDGWGAGRARRPRGLTVVKERPRKTGPGSAHLWRHGSTASLRARSSTWDGAQRGRQTAQAIGRARGRNAVGAAARSGQGRKGRKGLCGSSADVGRVARASAGTRAALDEINKLAEGSRDMSRIRAASLRPRGGKRPGAILKLAGRGAIVLAVGHVSNLATWLFWAARGRSFGLFSSLKRTARNGSPNAIARRRRLRRGAAASSVPPLALIPHPNRTAALGVPATIPPGGRERPSRQVTNMQRFQHDGGGKSHFSMRARANPIVLVHGFLPRRAEVNWL